LIKRVVDNLSAGTEQEHRWPAVFAYPTCLTNDREERMVINHIVLLNWKEETDPETVDAAIAALRALAGEIPEVVSSACGPAIAAAKFTHGLIVQLADREALQVYLDNAAHQDVVQRYIRPHAAEVVALDFES
jgi:Stress responsive A/B Barrel Domain